MNWRRLRRTAQRTPMWAAYAALLARLERALDVEYDPRRYWESHAAEYVEERLARPRGSEDRELRIFEGEVLSSSPRRVLEVGCAYGRILRRLAEREKGLLLVGVDLSERMLEFARQHVHALSTTLVRADAVRLPFASSSFDVVCTYGLLMHVPSPAISAVVAELSRVSCRRLVSLELVVPANARREPSSSYRASRVSFAHDYEGLFATRGWPLAAEHRLGRWSCFAFERASREP